MALFARLPLPGNEAVTAEPQNIWAELTHMCLRQSQKKYQNQKSLELRKFLLQISRRIVYTINKCRLWSMIYWLYLELWAVFCSMSWLASQKLSNCHDYSGLRPPLSTPVSGYSYGWRWCWLAAVNWWWMSVHCFRCAGICAGNAGRTGQAVLRHWH